MALFISFATSEGLPFFLLSLQRKKNWYYFVDYGVESSTLAKNIYTEDPDTVIIFGERRNDQMEFPDHPCLFISASPARIVAHKKNIGTKCKIFLMKENDIGSNIRAATLYALPVEVYARTANRKNALSGNIRFFHSYDCYARQYWNYGPVRDDAARQHPLLCPYQELTSEQKQERDAAWELLYHLAMQVI